MKVAAFAERCAIESTASRFTRASATVPFASDEQEGSLYDAIGPEYTLLRLDPEVDVAQLVAAARQRGVPLAVVDVDSCETVGLYTTKLVLSRPDQHVAWRGDACPGDSLSLIDLIRGAGPR
jgi:hypothetical protein